MDLDARIVIGILALANVVVAAWVGTIVPNLWMAVFCVGVLCFRPLIRKWRSHRLEALWKRSGGSPYPPPDDYVTV